MQVQHRAHVAALQLLLLVSIAQERQHHAVNAQRRLDAVGDVALVRHRVEVFQRLAGVVLMLRQVVIRAVGDAPEFTPAEREQEFEVRRRLGVERQLLRLMVAQAQAVLFDAQRKQPLLAEANASSRTTRKSSPGLQKNSSSICSNSRTRKMKLPGVISLRKDLPICAMPAGSFLRVERMTLAKLTKMPCAVSGRR